MNQALHVHAYVCLITKVLKRFFISIFISCLLFINNTASAQVGISSTSITPDASSILELRSTSAGFLPPRMTTAQRDAITSPATGLLIYNTSTSQLNYYTGSAWQIISSGGTSGTVTSVSVASANGFGGTVATSTSTPSITVSTSITGVLKGNGTAISAATSGTDYSPGTSGLTTGIIKSTTGTGVLSIANASDFPTLNQSTTGNAATVTTNANLTGDVTSVGNATTLATVNGNVGTWNNVTVNGKGLVTGGSNVSYLSSYTETDPTVKAVNGLVKSNGTTISAATVRTDYAEPTTALATGLLKNTTTTGAHSIAVAGTDYALPNANTTGTASNVTGTVAVSNGGTGQTTANAALNALLPTQTSNANKVLQTDGTNTSWSTAAVGDMILAGVQTITGSKTFNYSKLVLAGSTSGTTTLNANAIAGAGTVTLPTTGTLVTLSGSEVLTNKDLTGAGNTFPTLNQNTTGTAASISGANVITNSNLSQMAANTIKGNNTAGTANALDLTAAQVKTMIGVTGSNSGDVTLTTTGSTGAATLTGQALNIPNYVSNLALGTATTSTLPITNSNGTGLTLPAFTTSAGLVPGTSSSTINFLRADGTWAIPPAVTATETDPVVKAISGIVKSNGVIISAATSGTDYSAGTSALGTGILKSTTATGALSIAIAGDFPVLNQSTTGNAATVTTNANLTGPITSVGNTTSVASQTGTGSTFVMNTSPTLVTPNLGTPSSLNLTNATGLPVSTGITGLAAGIATFIGAPSSANLQSALTDGTGTGLAVFSASPIFTGTPTLPTGTIATTQPFGDASTKLATTAFVDAETPMYARVTGSNATTTGAALTNITGLSVALAANTVYEFYAHLSVASTTVAGTKYGINYSVSGATVEASYTGTSSATATVMGRISALNTATGVLMAVIADGGVAISGVITTGANAGNLTVQQAKVTSGTSTVYTNSFLKVIKIQ